MTYSGEFRRNGPNSLPVCGNAELRAKDRGHDRTQDIGKIEAGRLWVSPRAPHGADVRFTVPLWAER